MRTDTQRQKRFAENRRQAGLRALKLWLPEADIAALREAFPGPRGGIDWSRVVAQALSGRSAPVIAAVTSSPIPIPAEEPYPYWRPRRDAPMDPICQGVTVRGDRCRAKGTALIAVLDTNGMKGEFNACEHHFNEYFRPHPSVCRRQ